MIHCFYFYNMRAIIILHILSPKSPSFHQHIPLTVFYIIVLVCTLWMCFNICSLVDLLSLHITHFLTLHSSFCYRFNLIISLYDFHLWFSLDKGALRIFGSGGHYAFANFQVNFASNSQLFCTSAADSGSPISPSKVFCGYYCCMRFLIMLLLFAVTKSPTCSTECFLS